MSEEVRKKAVEMLLNGATLLSEPCPYCKGVRVMKEGNALCVSCGKSPDKEIDEKSQNPKDNDSPVKQLEENVEAKLKDQIEKRQVLAEAKIEQLTRDANNLIQSHISSTAIAATVSILQQKLNNQEQQKLIDKSIEELGSALKN